MKKKINIKDIAKETGFSMMTVSRALSNPSLVSAKTKNKIEKIIKKRGYIPNFFAHGYECLSTTATILYHLDNYRDQKNEFGLPYNDKDLKLKWKTNKPILSSRDKEHMSFKEFKKKIKTL